MSGRSALDAFIAGVESLRSLNEDVARAAEQPVADVVRASAARGESPSGEAWAPLVDGGRALEGAAAAIESSASGTRITLRIGPPWVFHNHGAGGSSATKAAEQHRERAAHRHASAGTASKFHAPRRQILPRLDEPVPAPINEAIADAAKRVFGEAVG